MFVTVTSAMCDCSTRRRLPSRARPCADESENDSDVVRRKAPENILLAADFAEI